MNNESAKATVRRFFQAWNESNLDAIDDLFTPDYAVNGNEVTPEGVKRAVVGLHATFHNPVVTIEEMVAEDNRVVVRWSLRGTHLGELMGLAPTGKRLESMNISLDHVVDGKVVEPESVEDNPKNRPDRVGKSISRAPEGKRRRHAPEPCG